jgi:hypothetical protein
MLPHEQQASRAERQSFFNQMSALQFLIWSSHAFQQEVA